MRCWLSGRAGITGRPCFSTWPTCFALLLIVSFVWAWANINWLYVSRMTRTRRTQVGEPLDERFVVRNTSVVPKLWLEVHDYSTCRATAPAIVVNNLGPRGSFTWRVTTICTERGRYQLGPIR
jgi:uncharacterized protein (DUF58 family)